VAAYYRRRAENDVGLIITEGTVVDHPVSSVSSRIPNFFGAGLDGWQGVVNSVHDAGGKIAPHLWHLGMARDAEAKVPNAGVPSVGPSGLTLQGEQRSQPADQATIETLIAAFVRGAGDARRLEFDAIELHGAHGYLIDQFFWEGTNRRVDRYGGDIGRRTRFAAEMIAGIRTEVGPAFPIILRFSQWKQDNYSARLANIRQELATFLEPLVDAGVDIFHCSTRRFWQPEFPGSELNLAGWTRRLTGRPTISVGSVGLSNEFAGGTREGAARRGIEDLLERMARDEFDLIAVGRALLGDPQWARKIRQGRLDELQDFAPEAYATLV
jgi:2,4-dienoyl-CoA reductase-like NADH-dependent reductase (Old Yellow Enzyme family)